MSTFAERLRDAIDRRPPRGRAKGIRLFSERLQEYVEKQSANGVDLRGAGVSYPYIHKYLKGELQPSAEFIAAAAVVLGVREEWLARGEGPMTDMEEARAAEAAGASPFAAALVQGITAGIRSEEPTLDRLTVFGRAAMERSWSAVRGATLNIPRAPGISDAEYAKEWFNHGFVIGADMAAGIYAAADVFGIDLKQVSAGALESYVVLTSEALVRVAGGYRDSSLSPLLPGPAE